MSLFNFERDRLVQVFCYFFGHSPVLGIRERRPPLFKGKLPRKEDLPKISFELVCSNCGKHLPVYRLRHEYSESGLYDGYPVIETNRLEEIEKYRIDTDAQPWNPDCIPPNSR